MKNKTKEALLYHFIGATGYATLGFCFFAVFYTIYDLISWLFGS